ncbi:periplasmic monoheme cytochrome c553 [Malaciobacter marinus]|uniref:Cytochrome C n=1 Tax=Malaciobacter marinus TaxID=505249 RepID=A0A347TL40_9BACT|nr:c-type cytochrome [Malaciobacter marinus]AXX87318.1 periplasmic monoheme cytochrome c553 [Malaciobacter marinus]PHO15572.1 cytochrome C [Malaciobacter marinus]
MTTTKKILVSIAILGSITLFANSGESLYKACASCHGANGEKAALGKSEVIKGWDSKKVQNALHGYKDGTYGKVMKGVMKGQVARLSDEDIKALGDYIATFK